MEGIQQVVAPQEKEYDIMKLSIHNKSQEVVELIVRVGRFMVKVAKHIDAQGTFLKNAEMMEGQELIDALGGLWWNINMTLISSAIAVHSGPMICLWHSKGTRTFLLE